MDNTRTAEQQEALNQARARGVAFSDIVSTDGWNYVKAYVQARITLFANDALGEGFKTMEEYQRRRGEVNGLRELLAEVEESIKLVNERTNEQTKT